MADLSKNPYVIAVIGALLSAALAWVYERTLTRDPVQLKRAFTKTLVASLVALCALAWWASRPEPTLTEPFAS